MFMGNLKVESVAELTGHIVGMMVHSFLSKKLINLTAQSLGSRRHHINVLSEKHKTQM